ncbi:hypothetical protein [Salinispora arenicola]|uniref:hypothetical protein n=1 Tax=Salinispora arenicola TaxID=168697 RepID=UPI0003787A16|nr:hypothetical protein [Salinispora arenicola]
MRARERGGVCQVYAPSGLRLDEETLDGDALAAAALKVLAELVDAAAGLFGGAVSADSEPSMTGRRWQSMQTG